MFNPDLPLSDLNPCSLAEWLALPVKDSDRRYIKAAGGGNSFQDMKPLDKKLFEVAQPPATPPPTVTKQLTLF
jgi:hypothetical protein